MRDHLEIIWMDASIRFIYTGSLSHIKHQLVQTGGILQMVKAGHSIFAATHPQLYTFFPSDMEKIKQTGMEHLSTVGEPCFCSVRA